MNRVLLVLSLLALACATDGAQGPSQEQAAVQAAPAPAPAPAPAESSPPSQKDAMAMKPSDPAVGVLERKTARFAPVVIDVNLDHLPPHERRALALIVQASRVTDPLFLRQTWAGNEAMLFDLLNRRDQPMGRARLHAFLLNKGPWSRLDENEVFIPGAPPKPHAGNFYPAGATKQEVEAWIARLPKAEKAKATGFFHTLRRGADGKFISVPYSLEYQGELAYMAELFREAAQLTQQPTLKAFLTSRADAFLSNDYYASDVAWMKLDASIEPTVGPYEVYEDEWFNYKAAFEAFVTLRDDAETEKLAKFSGELQDIENHLPIDPKYRNPKLGALAPIRVVNSLFSAGDANRGVQTAAFNLPNDERIAAQMGTKRVMLKNIQEAKFQRVLLPISKVALRPEDQALVDFDAFFTHILMHELMHGLGPHNITVKDQATTVRQVLQESSSAIEEAKADVSGLFALQYLVDKGVLDKKYEQTMYVTFLASAFRSIRFGLNEAHGKGIAMQLNYLLDQGGFVVNPDGTFSVDTTKIREGVRALTAEFMTLQAQGDKARARKMLNELGVLRPQVAAVLAKLEDVPVDIEPRYHTAEVLMQELASQARAAPSSGH